MVVKVQLTEVIVVKSEKSIELLNKSVADELAAVHQSMYFHFRLDDLGFTPLAWIIHDFAGENRKGALKD